jgi:hypothetical protein
VAAELGVELIAGGPWFGNHQFGGAKTKAVTDAEIFFEHAFGCQILTKHAVAQIHHSQLAAPELVVF